MRARPFTNGAFPPYHAVMKQKNPLQNGGFPMSNGWYQLERGRRGGAVQQDCRRSAPPMPIPKPEPRPAPAPPAQPRAERGGAPGTERGSLPKEECAPPRPSASERSRRSARRPCPSQGRSRPAGSRAHPPLPCRQPGRSRSAPRPGKWSGPRSRGPGRTPTVTSLAFSTARPWDRTARWCCRTWRSTRP